MVLHETLSRGLFPAVISLDGGEIFTRKNCEKKSGFKFLHLISNTDVFGTLLPKHMTRSSG